MKMTYKYAIMASIMVWGTGIFSTQVAANPTEEQLQGFIAEHANDPKFKAAKELSEKKNKPDLFNKWAIKRYNEAHRPPAPVMSDAEREAKQRADDEDYLMALNMFGGG